MVRGHLCVCVCVCTGVVDVCDTQYRELILNGRNLIRIGVCTPMRHARGVGFIGGLRKVRGAGGMRGESDLLRRSSGGYLVAGGEGGGEGTMRGALLLLW